MSTVYHRPADPSGDDSYVRPLFADRCQAGFPSPATDYAEQELDPNSYCISRPAATFFLRASGESMNQAGVQNGDLLVVDRAEKPQHGDIVIAEIDGEFTVKRLLLRPRPALEPVSDSPEFRTLYPENICIFGVVTHVIHRTRELR
ncbi:TPA: translesion error-prone DNA polymerase V autoproteolytic subunit [Escherichia coli]|nr:translesion error-prone DNA polymerase V autoproteolytic subunit [Escherichia coli]